MLSMSLISVKLSFLISYWTGKKTKPKLKTHMTIVKNSMIDDVEEKGRAK